MIFFPPSDILAEYYFDYCYNDSSEKKKNIGSDLVRTVQLVLLLPVVMMLTIKSTFIIRYAKAFTQSICIMTVTFQKVMVQLNVFTCTVVLGTTLVVCG